MDTPNPLAHGNRFQRAYYRWALPYYERFGRQDPLLRERVELADIYLYTRRGLAAWAGWWLVLVGTTLWVHGQGKGWGVALAVAGAGWIGLSCALLGAWMAPTPQMSPNRHMRAIVRGVALGVAAAMLVLMGLKGLDGTLDLERLRRTLYVVVPTGGGIMLLLGVVARAGKAAHERQLSRLQLVAERDAAARHAAEADLRLLQAQIHPHFVFNTLATLQHWVDRRDERAGPLLRELTGFLRRSTELLGRATVPLAEEVQAVRHYLGILATRLDGRVARMPR